MKKNTLIFVDRQLSISIAANLVGVLQTNTVTDSTNASVSWLVRVGFDQGEATTNQLDAREMLPEDLIYYFHDYIENRFTNLEEALPKLSTGASASFIPGNVISINGVLRFNDLEIPENYSPFSPVEIPINKVMFHGEECIVAELRGDNGSYRIPVFLPVSSSFQVLFCQNQPVEITGVLRWIPPYSPGGASSLNLAIRAAAVWLR